MSKKKVFKVEFNESGFINEGVWVVLDETAEVEADTAEEAIDSIIDWFVETDPEYSEIDSEIIRQKYTEYVWRATERDFERR